MVVCDLDDYTVMALSAKWIVTFLIYCIIYILYIYSDLKHTMDIHGLCITVDCDVP